MKGRDYLWPSLLWACSAAVRHRLSVSSPFTAKQHGYSNTEREQKLIRISEKSHQELVSEGLLYRGPASHAYWNRIGLRLVPEAVKQTQSFRF